MIFSYKARDKLFKVFAALFLIAAVYHVIAVFYKVDESPIWRHLLFVAINLFCIYGILKRPNFFLFFIALLLVQQYYSHGSYLVSLWNAKRQIHWISILDLIFFSLVLICLIESKMDD
jgi:hypothetical protein